MNFIPLQIGKALPGKKKKKKRKRSYYRYYYLQQFLLLTARVIKVMETHTLNSLSVH